MAPAVCGRPKRQGDPPGQPCKSPAGWGTPTPGIGPCKRHGGCLPVVVEKNRRVMAEQEANTYLAQYVVEPVSDPVGELQSLTGRVKAFTAYCEQRFLESGNGEWLGLHARSMGELAKQLEVLSRVLPPVQAAKAETAKRATDDEVARVIDAFNTAMHDPAVALTTTQINRAKSVMGHALGGEDAPPARAGLRGADTAVNVLGTLRRFRPDYAGWSDAEREDTDRIWRAAAALVDAWGEPGEVVAGTLPPTSVRALEAAVEDAVVVEDESPAEDQGRLL